MVFTSKEQVFCSKKSFISWIGGAATVVTLMIGTVGISFAADSCTGTWKDKNPSTTIGPLCVPIAACTDNNWGYDLSAACDKSAAACHKCKCDGKQICMGAADGNRPSDKGFKIKAVAGAKCGDGKSVLCTYTNTFEKGTTLNCLCKCTDPLPAPVAVASGRTETTPKGSKTLYEGLQKPGATTSPKASGSGNLYEGIESPAKR